MQIAQGGEADERLRHRSTAGRREEPKVTDRWEDGGWLVGWLS